MPDRSKQHGYSYREVAPEVPVTLETPQPQDAPNRVQPTVTVGQRDTSTPIADAIIDVAGDEISAGREKSREQQAIDGAIQAGTTAGMDEIAKRKSIDDWIFGSRARTASAAKVRASTNITEYTSDQISQMNKEERTDPELYIERQRKLISDAAKKIEQDEGKEVANAFVTMASQRVEQLVNLQLQRHHDFIQKEAASNYQKDLIMRASLLAQLYTEPGMEMIADAELNALFDMDKRPDDMTEEAAMASWGQVIISEAQKGNRRLYEYADQHGILDDMPAELRAKTDEAYKRAAPTNNLEFINADEDLRNAIQNPAVSLNEFIEFQKRYIHDWDTVHSYTDEQLAQQRIRKEQYLKDENNDAHEMALAKDAYLRGDHAYLSGITTKFRNGGADLAIMELAKVAVHSSMEQEAFEQLPLHDQRAVAYEALKQDPVLMNHTVEISARAGYVPATMKHIFNDSVGALIFDGEPNAKAIETLELQRQYLYSHPGFIGSAVKDHALLESFDTLRRGGHSAESAVTMINEGRKNPTSPDTYRREARDEALNESLDTLIKNIEAPRQGWGIPLISSRGVDNAAALREDLTLLANEHMNRGHNPTDAYNAAANELTGAYEILGNSAIRTNGIALTARSGLPPDTNFETELTNYLHKETRKGNVLSTQLQWNKKSKLTDYLIGYAEDTNRITLTPRSGDIVSMHKQVGIPLENIGASHIPEPIVDPELISQGQAQREEDAARQAELEQQRLAKQEAKKKKQSLNIGEQ